MSGAAADRAAFESAGFEAERPRLIGVAYRMLGDVGEAEDVVQEAFVRWTERVDTQAVERPAAYLTTIVTRLSIDRLRSARVRRETYVGPWLAEPVLFDPPASSEPGPDDQVTLADSVTLGFLRLLDTLSPTERAVFLLRDVFEHPYASIAGIVDKTEEATRQIASRARKKVSAHRGEVPRRPRTEREVELVAAFASALADADIDQIRAVVTEDVVATSDGGGVKHAAVVPVVGAARVSRFFAGIAKRAPADTRVELASVNGEPAFVVFYGDELDLVLVVGATDDGIDHVHTIRNPDKLGAIERGYRLAY